MRFSLVLATVGRVSELEHLLQSLDAQTYRNFELIVVDQNPDNRLVPILERYKRKVAIVHLHSTPGLSRARNVGLQHVTGDVVAFPDDDCWYPKDLLERVKLFFEKRPQYDALTGRPAGPDGKTAVGRFDLRPGEVTKYNIWRRSTSITLFLRRSVISAVGEFDESLGAGSGTPWGAAEDIDYPLRALSYGFKIYYDPTLVVHHPEPIMKYRADYLQRVMSYSAGMGRVLRKHKYPLWFVCYQWLRPLGGVLISLLVGRLKKARYHWAVLKGRVMGWWAAD